MVLVTLENIMSWAGTAVTKPEVDPYLLYAIAKVESSLSPTAYNEKTKAAGLFQLTPICLADLRKRWGLPIDPFDPPSATKGASVYLSWLMREFPEDLTLVLAAWNWGIGNVKKWLRDELELPEETRKFVDKVLREWERVKKLDKMRGDPSTTHHL